MMKSTLLAVTLAFSLGIAAQSAFAGLYFSTDGDDLLIMARNAPGDPAIWGLRITQAATATPDPVNGPLGRLSEFYDWTGAAGSDPSLNISRSVGLLSMYMTSSGGTPSGSQLNTRSSTTMTAPSVASLVDGADSYTFSLTGTFGDYQSSGAMATFTTEITINAPDQDGTYFEFVNTLTTPEDWVSGSSLSAGGRESRSRVRSLTTDMVGAILESDGGTRGDNDWYAQKTATADSTGYAAGRILRIRQIQQSNNGTADAYLHLRNNTSESGLETMLSGAFRGNAAADRTYTSTGYFYTNIVIPEPASMALLGLGGLVMLARRR